MYKENDSKHSLDYKLSTMDSDQIHKPGSRQLAAMPRRPIIAATVDY